MKRLVIATTLVLGMLASKAQIWTQLDGGLEATPTATTSNATFLASASIIHANDSFRLHRISLWNGYYWQHLPIIKADPKSLITSLAFYKGALYIAGRFDSISGLTGAKNIIRWRDRLYENPPSLSSSINDFTLVQQLVVYNNLLMLAGPFAEQSGVNGKNIAFYNGSTLVTTSASSPYGKGVSGNLSTVYTNGNILAIGGRFNSVDDTAASQLAFLYKDKWHRTLSNNIIPQRITSLHDSVLYFYGNKLNSKDLGIYKTTGTHIDTIQSGIKAIAALFDIITVADKVYASGIFDMNDANVSQNLIVLEGDTWKTIKNGAFTGLRRLENYKNSLIGTGPFVYGNLQKLNFIARYMEKAGMITGQVYFDKDENCEITTRDESLTDMYLLIKPGNHIVKPGIEGRFFYLLPEGEYTVYIIHNKYWRSSECHSDSLKLKLVSGEVQDKVDFPMVQHTGIRDLSVKLSSSSGLRVTKNRHVAYTITYENSGSENVNQTEIILNMDPKMTAVKFDPGPGSVNGDTAKWLIKDLFSGETGKIECVFELNNSTDEILHMTASIPLLDNEANPMDNESSLTQTLSEEEYEFHKTVLSGHGGDSVSLQDTASRIEYLISFANYTSDTIFNVYIVDTIKLNHSLTYIKTTAASHDVTTEAYPGKIGEDLGIIVWTFTGINLYPNPNHEPEIVSHRGFISFELGLSDALAMGMVLNNRATVVFDYYDPVITNTTYALVSNQTLWVEESSPEPGLRLYPNPTDGTILIRSEELNLDGTSYRVYGLNGQEQTQGVLGFDGSIELSHLSPGVYFIQLQTEDKLYTLKFVRS